MRRDYKVIWEIDIAANSMREAAEIALDIQRDPDSCATFFKVTDRLTGKTKTINLGEDIPA